MTNHQVEELALDALAAHHVLAANEAASRARKLRHDRLTAEGVVSGFCHCNGFFRGSDHCQCCGCEEHENTCIHVCDGVGCSIEHDHNGRVI